MVCSSGVGFNPVVNGQRFNLELFGLYNAVMVMNDRETGSIWSHLGGEAVDGPMKGSQLEIIPLAQVTWERWLELHPDTLVLSNDTPFKGWYSDTGIGSPGLGPDFIASIVNWDDRLPHNELVLGVTAEGAFRAYPLLVIIDSGGIINDTLADKPVVIFMDASSVFSIAFSREVNGQVLQFENVGDEGLKIVDKKTGSTWNLEGQAVTGPLEGETLSFVTSFITEWYGWSAYHPQTDIYGVAPQQ